MDEQHREFSRLVLMAVGIAALVAGLVLVVVYAADVMLMSFAAILFAVFLRSLAEQTARYTGLQASRALAVVVLALAAFMVAAGWLLAPDVAEQFVELRQQVPRALQQARDALERQEWAQPLLQHAGDAAARMPGGEVLSPIAGFFSSTLGALVSLVVVLFLGLYLAADPRLYIDGLVRLFPRHKRRRTAEVLAEVGHTLRWWLMGQAISMTFIGATTTVGLWLMGVPLALLLGLISGLLTFVPNIGPIMAAVPVALMALTVSPVHVLYVVGFYAAIQLFEGYVLTPLVQQQMVSLPPALLLLAQVLMGVLMGVAGLALAAPLVAALLVLVRRLYVEDILLDPEGAEP